MEKKINFKEARITIAKALLAELDEPVTKLLSEISDNEEYSLADRLEMIEAVPFVAGEIVDKLYSTIEYYEEQIENEKNKEECIEDIKIHSRHFAKRQYTFFNHQMDVKWFCDTKEALNEVRKWLI